MKKKGLIQGLIITVGWSDRVSRAAGNYIQSLQWTENQVI